MTAVNTTVEFAIRKTFLGQYVYVLRWDNNVITGKTALLLDRIEAGAAKDRFATVRRVELARGWRELRLTGLTWLQISWLRSYFAPPGGPLGASARINTTNNYNALKALQGAKRASLVSWWDEPLPVDWSKFAPLDWTVYGSFDLTAPEPQPRRRGGRRKTAAAVA